MPKINLRQLVLCLTCGSVLLTLFIALVSGGIMHRDLLLDKGLEANRLYAGKIAKTTDLYLRMSLQRLAYAGDEVAGAWTDAAQRQSIVTRLREDASMFDAVLVVGADGTVLATDPPNLGLRGRRLDTVGAREALAQRAPMISRPFVGAMGRLIITLTSPIEDEAGQYLGYVSGSLYLHRDGLLSSLLGEHDFMDGSYLYVVDDEGRVLYHQDRAWVGALREGDPAVAAVRAGRSGAMRLTNANDVPVLAGYAPVAVADWGVIASQPEQATLAELSALVWRNLAYTLPGLALSFALIWALSAQISKPLAQIARRAGQMEEPDARDRLERVRSWYFEAAQIKSSLLRGLSGVQGRIRRLNEESQTDQLTGLANRRAMEAAAAAWQAAGASCAVVLVDIDRFKLVNDRLGHDVGDRVLQHLARVLAAQARPGDLACRLGGEEFALFMPATPLPFAVETAERLRLAVAAQRMAGVGEITVSCGVAHLSHLPDTEPGFSALVKAADVALYRAKAQGRNRTEVAAAV
ncbi:sensor domain-containing diguanylate cyclase [Verticiella sediminum]|nr:sensor domain-containing diguanylate cyclase [Verticiella sediminum]